jgi:hypothetical protein
VASRLNEIPDWIRLVHKEEWFPTKDFLNAFERLSASETRLYGTETMYGDWDGRILLVLQDWCNNKLLEDRIREKHPDPWSHNSGMPTNTRLAAGFGPEGTRDILYSSALANLLKKTDDASGHPQVSDKVLSFLARVMNFTFTNMQNLQVVVCFGRYAEDVVLASDCCLTAHFDEVRGTPNAIVGSRKDGQPLRVFASKHARLIKAETMRELANAARAACW